jgi:competence protein ComEC
MLPWSLAAGVIAGSLYLLPAPPSLTLVLMCFGVCLGLGALRYFFPKSVLTVLLLMSLGCFWGLSYTYYFTRYYAAHAVFGARHVCGWIDSVPRPGAHFSSFRLQAEQGGLLQLSWYSSKHSQPRLKINDYWCFQVRLKAIHGLANPGAADVELRAYLRGITARGYVLAGSAVRDSSKRRSRFFADLRQYWFDWLQDHVADEDVRGLMAALALGVRTLSSEQQGLYQQAGINHLIAISGLHIGLIAGFAYWFFSALCWCLPLSYRYCPRQDIAMLWALLAAGAYAFLAGFSLPTQRALLMLTVGTLARFGRVKISLSQNLQTVFIFSLILYPWGVLDISFALSFLAVAFILIGVGYRGARRWAWLRCQLAVSLGLLPIVAWFFQSISVIGFVINCYAIPWVSVVILPLCLLTLFSSAWPSVNHLLLQLTTMNIHALHWTLASLVQLPGATISVGVGGGVELLLLVGIVLLLLAPKQWPGKSSIGLLLLLWCGVRGVQDVGVRLTVLDVGQGLSVVFHYQGRVLVYDTGPRFGNSDAALRVIIPYLRHARVRRIDTLIVSHGDLDHRGGLVSLVKAFPVGELLSGEPKRLQVPSRRCKVGQHWHWGDAHFRIIHPGNSEVGNNASCVLVIEFAGQRIILPGDIEHGAEAVMAKRLPGHYPTTVLVAAHHGSKTSSSPRLMRQLQPHYLVFSTGYKNHYRFPHQRVVRRYCHRSECLNTADSGAVYFDFKSGVQVFRYRASHRHFWSAQPVQK